MRIGVDEAGEQRSVGDRLLLILDTVAAAPGEVGLSELARLTGLKKATVHRLASDLVGKRMLERGTYGYRLGLHLFELGQRVPVSRRLRDTALPVMSDLLQATSEIVQLGMLDGADVVYVEKLTGPHSIDAPSAVGSRLPAYCSGLGKAILAFSPDEVVDEVLAAPMPARTSTTITSADRLRRELARVRETGVAYDREEGNRGIVCVAAPIVARKYAGRPEDTAIAAVSITGPSTRLQLIRFEAAVRTAALSISRTLNSPFAAPRRQPPRPVSRA
jgi:IclR family transcriptional regulator, acetate operon repressor